MIMTPFAGPGELEQRLVRAADSMASVVDQTFGKTVLRLSGGSAREMLAKGCRIDLHPRAFAPGRAVVTPIAQISCAVVQVDAAPTFDLVVPSTLAGAFVDWVLASAAEFGCEIRGPSD